MADSVGPTAFIPEVEVAERWPILTLRELKKARRQREIAFYQSPVGPHYKADDVEEFIEGKYRQCRAIEPEPVRPSPQKPRPVGRMEPTISTVRTPNAAASGTHASMTPEHERLRAAAYERRISKKPKSSSSASPTQHRHQPKTPRAQETSAP